MNDLIPVLGIIVTIGFPIVGAIILGSKAINGRHLERMGLINQGIIPPMSEPRKRIPNRYNSLRNGIILASLGVGLIVGLIYITQNQSTLSEETRFFIVVSSVAFFIGMGYLLFFWLTKNANMDDNDKPQIEE